MDIVKAFNTNDLHTEIVIKGTLDDPLFRASDVGVILDISNIRTSIADFDDSEKRAVHTMDGTGRLQDITFLTEKGLYKVLFRSRKPIAQKFQNWVCDVIKEIRVTGIYNMQKEIDKKQEELEEKQEELEKTKDEMASLEDTKNKEYETKLEKEKVIEREKILLKEYDTASSIVYVIKVKTLEHVGKYIIKIGESRRGISGRYNEHKSKYEECVLLDCFCVHRSKDFENFIHNHESVRLNRVTDLKNHEKEHELFLIGRNLSYQTLHQIITSNMKNFNDVNTSSLELEIEKLKLLVQMKEDKNENGLLHELVNSVNQLTNSVKQLSGKVDANEKQTKEMMEKMSASQVKTTTGFNTTLVTLGPRLQKIHPDTLELVKVYESVSEVMKENSDIKRPSMNKAVRENTVYHGYRWLLVDRDLDASVVHGIVLPTKKTRPQNLGYIAQLNGDKTKILNVYIDRKTAAHCNGYESSGLDVPVKKSTISRGFYYKLYDDCDEELRTTFELEFNNCECPLLYRNGIGQYDAQGNLVRVHACKYDCIRTLKMSDKTLFKALSKNVDYNGFYFKEIGEKLKSS
jgi:prophage antirepressor-like protein